MFIDAHCHASPWALPDAPDEALKGTWPCMRCASQDAGALFLGDTRFRELDSRSWNAERRLEDMERDRVDMQILSPMPELLSYWFDPAHAERICDATNDHIAKIVAAHPRRFRGLGAIPLQDPAKAPEHLMRLKADFELSGVEIGSNIAGRLLHDPAFDPFWAAAEDLGLSIFVHALHPVVAKAIELPPPLFTPLALFPLDVGMSAASLLMAGVLSRYPRLRIAFSHGGGALPGMLGRLDAGWEATEGCGGKMSERPSASARRLFYDSNVYDGRYLSYLAQDAAPNQVFMGTDYPYDIMQKSPVEFIEGAGLGPDSFASVSSLAAMRFLDERQ
ncbi:MAG: amidohydrolase [Sphingomonadales bacterium]|nr:MAG: amidohydrolase [Sphingomonadales bacterium]